MSVISKGVDGIEISLMDGSRRIVPLLTRDELEKWRPEVAVAEIEWSKDEDSSDIFSLPLTVIFAAMQRRYPTMTRDELEENLDSRTLKQLWQQWWILSALNVTAGPKQ
jgi:hypothetical protein